MIISELAVEPFFDEIKEEPKHHRKRRKRQQQSGPKPLHLYINSIIPKTENQKLAFKSFTADKNMFLHGTAGTGKSFIAFYLMLSSLLTRQGPQEKIYIVRSVVPSRDIGFLPGKPRDKALVYESPYYAICTELFGQGDAYEILKQKGLVEFVTTSFLRGTTFSNCFLLIDESQNMDSGEMHTIMTRVGQNCRVIFTGDIKQNDLLNSKTKSGLRDFAQVLKRMKSFDFIEFGPHDILRSDLVKEYILMREELEENGTIKKLSEGI